MQKALEKEDFISMCYILIVDSCFDFCERGITDCLEVFNYFCKKERILNLQRRWFFRHMTIDCFKEILIDLWHGVVVVSFVLFPNGLYLFFDTNDIKSVLISSVLTHIFRILNYSCPDVLVKLYKSVSVGLVYLWNIGLSGNYFNLRFYKLKTRETYLSK